MHFWCAAGSRNERSVEIRSKTCTFICTDFNNPSYQFNKSVLKHLYHGDTRGSNGDEVNVHPCKKMARNNPQDD
jgi:hypothetical protein